MSGILLKRMYDKRILALLLVLNMFFAKAARGYIYILASDMQVWIYLTDCVLFLSHNFLDIFFHGWRRGRGGVWEGKTHT